MTTALLDRLTHYCDNVETGMTACDSKARDDDHAIRARLVSAIPPDERYRQTPLRKGANFAGR
jgi:hypothetical protein